MHDGERSRRQADVSPEPRVGVRILSWLLLIKVRVGELGQQRCC